MLIQYTHYFKCLIIFCQVECILTYFLCSIVGHLDYFWVLLTNNPVYLIFVLRIIFVLKIFHRLFRCRFSKMKLMGKRT